MRFPSVLLTDRVVVEPYLGAGAYGPMYDTPVTLRARMEPRRRVVKRPGSESVVSTATAFVRSGQEVPVESRATWNGGAYEVLDVVSVQESRRPVLVELVLGPA